MKRLAVALLATVATFAAQAQTLPHASSNSLVAALTVKTAPGFLSDYNCTGITGGSAGFCIVYDSAFVPPTGALTGAQVIDFCYFDTTARGCSLSRIPLGISLTNGIQILMTSAATPFTYTTGTDTGAIEADFQ